jgi:hypothetical protein
MPTVRKRTKSNNNHPSPPFTPADLPPPRKSDAIKRNVSPPLSNTHLHRLIYLLVFVTALLSLYYVYHAVQWKVAEWSAVLSPRHGGMKNGENDRSEYATTWRGEKGVEDQIDKLARMLGVPRAELASAVAGVVREHVTPTTTGQSESGG